MKTRKASKFKLKLETQMQVRGPFCHLTILNLFLAFRKTVLKQDPFPLLGSKSGAVVRAFASHQCDLGSNPGVEAICGLSLLLVLVLSLAPRGFSSGTPVSPLFKNGHISTSFFSSSELLSIPWVNKLQFQFFK